MFSAFPLTRAARLAARAFAPAAVLVFMLHPASAAHANAARQCAFDPSGHFFPKGVLPAPFESIDHVTVWRKDEQHAEGPRAGVYDRSGAVYEFASFKDFGTFEFKTAAAEGVSYSFEGSFHLVCILEEEYEGRERLAFAGGRLAQFRDGRKVAETPVEFTYIPRLPGSEKNVDAPYPSGRTDLIYAAWRGDEARLRALLARKADVNARDRVRGYTALAYAVNFIDSSQPAKLRRIAKLLIDAGADVNVKDNGGRTVLMEAASLNHDLFMMLLAAGADVNVRDKYGWTALMNAASAAIEEWWTGNTLERERDGSPFENVRALLRAGARADEQNNFGDSALSLVKKSYGRFDPVRLPKAAREEAERLIRLLEEGRADK